MLLLEIFMNLKKNRNFLIQKFNLTIGSCRCCSCAFIEFDLNINISILTSNLELTYLLVVDVLDVLLDVSLVVIVVES